LRIWGRFAPLLLIAILAVLVAASSAAAAVTSSQITTPGGTTFTTFDEDNPNSIEVIGTTAGGSAADEVNIDCFGGGKDLHLATAVPLAGDGSFSVSAANLENITFHVCRLRAVPTGAVPANLAPFAGPLIGVGLRRLETIHSGEYAGQPYGFLVNDQQLGGADSFASLGRCGLQSASLYNANFEATTQTFGCNDWFWRFDDYENPVASDRSQIQVDGINAYTSRVVNEMYGGVKGFPAVTLSTTQDPLTGDIVIKDSESLVGCLTPAYPPSTESCPSFINTGVRDERTIEVTEDGRLVTIADRYASTDGKAHDLDLLPENRQIFAGPLSENGEAIAYSFPGESGYSVHSVGQSVPFAATAPGTVYIRVEGAEDGDQTAGRGAIVFDRPASPATFNAVNPEASSFYFHQAATIPAGGSTIFRFAYVQGYTSAEVQALATKAESAFAPPPLPTSPTPGPGPGAATPRTVAPQVKLTKVKLDRHRGTATIFAQASGPGALFLSGKGIARQKATSQGVGIVKLLVKAKGKAKKALDTKGKTVVRAKVTFTPQGGGAAITAARSITLREFLHH
jgi:hypothetical protein